MVAEEFRDVHVHCQSSVFALFSLNVSPRHSGQMSGIQWPLFWFVGAVGSIWVTDWQILPRITTAGFGVYVRLADDRVV